VGRQGSPVNNKKRARDGSPGPSRSRPDIKIKREELSGDVRAQRIRALQVSQGVVCFIRVAPDGTRTQAEMDALMATEKSGPFVKRERRSPSPIVVGHSGEVIDLTLDN